MLPVPSVSTMILVDEPEHLLHGLEVEPLARHCRRALVLGRERRKRDVSPSASATTRAL